MAQILKEDIRQDIIAAAIFQIEKDGIEKASMRSIANSAKVTVGNVYRYFKGKDELVSTIISPAMDAINNALLKASNEQLKLFGDVSENLTKEEIKDIICVFIDQMVDIYDKYPAVMKIILKNKQLSFNIINWLTQLIKQLKVIWANDKLDDELCEVYAIAIFTGVSHIFVNTKDKSRLSYLAKEYLKKMIEVVGE